MALLALVGLMGVTTAFAGMHKERASRLYGITGKTPGNADWTVELFTGTCTSNPATQCGVFLDDNNQTLQTAPINSGEPFNQGVKYQH